VCAIGIISLSGVTCYGFSIQNCAAIITHILCLIDDFGSHTMPVYKSLCVLIACVKSQYGPGRLDDVGPHS
jgi:hypothetical protein